MKESKNDFLVGKVLIASSFFLSLPLQRSELPGFDGATGSHRLATEDARHPGLGVCR